MSSLRDQYFRTLGFSENDADTSPHSKREKALNRAYALRTFEIEHYWKRATYFWGFQIAIFAAFGLLWKDPITNQPGPIAVGLSILGVLTAVANCLSAIGSGFWQRNWERHIEMLEDGIEGRLYKTVWLFDGKVSFSVSRINKLLGYFMVFFWVIVTSFVTYKFVWSTTPDWLHNLCSWWPPITISMVTFAVGTGVALLFRQTSDFTGSTLPPTDNGDRGTPIMPRSRWHRRIGASQTFIRRNAPDE